MISSYGPYAEMLRSGDREPAADTSVKKGCQGFTVILSCFSRPFLTYAPDMSADSFHQVFVFCVVSVTNCGSSALRVYRCQGICCPVAPGISGG